MSPPADVEPDLEAAIAELLGEPCWLSLETIGGLTDRQIIDLYHHPRDEEGRIRPRRKPARRELTPEQAENQALAAAVAFGCTQAQIDKLKARIAAARKERGREQVDGRTAG